MLLTINFSKQSEKKITSFSEYTKNYRNGTSEVIIVGRGLHGECFELYFANEEDEKATFEALKNAKNNSVVYVDCDCAFKCINRR